MASETIIKVSRKFLRYALDILLVLTGLVVLWSSYIVWFILPRGVGLHGRTSCARHGMGIKGNYEIFLGLNRYQWITVHNWTDVVFGIIIVIHIILHWNWFVETTKRFSHHLKSPAGNVIELYTAAVILFTLFVFDGLSGLVLWLVLPRGTGNFSAMKQGVGIAFLGLQRNIWVDMHAWVAVTITSIIIVHIILNWNWVVGVSRQILRRKLRADYR